MNSHTQVKWRVHFYVCTGTYQTKRYLPWVQQISHIKSLYVSQQAGIRTLMTLEMYGWGSAQASLSTVIPGVWHVWGCVSPGRCPVQREVVTLLLCSRRAHRGITSVEFNRMDSLCFQPGHNLLYPLMRCYCM